MTDDPAFTEWRRRIVPEFEGARLEAIAYLQALTINDGFLVEQYHKSRNGWAEHDGGIRYMTREQVEGMAREEVVDWLTYLSHLRAARA